MATKSRERLDRQAKENGWTHRLRNKSREPYVKLFHPHEDIGSDGATFTDMQQQFHYYAYEKVIKL